MMGMLALSFFLRIGIRSGCACKLVGGGLMILLSGIKGLGISAVGDCSVCSGFYKAVGA